MRRSQSRADVVLTREGHLAEVTANAFLAGELSADARRHVDHHLATCSLCRIRLEQTRAFDADLWQKGVLNPPMPGGRTAVIKLRPRRSRRLVPMVVLGTAVAAAAAVLLTWRPASPTKNAVALHMGQTQAQSPTQTPTQTPILTPGDTAATGVGYDGIRAKASEFDVVFYANDADGTHRLVDGDIVHPGNRIGFKVYTRHSGHLLIIGTDDGGAEEGVSYLCYPQHLDGNSIPVGEHRAGRALDQAIELDDVLGREYLVALFCPEPINESAIAGPLTTAIAAGDGIPPLLRKECQQKHIVMHKQAPPTEPVPKQRDGDGDGDGDGDRSSRLSRGAQAP